MRNRTAQASIASETADCKHCAKPIRRNSKGYWGARKRDDLHPWYCDASQVAAKRHEPGAVG